MFQTFFFHNSVICISSRYTVTVGGTTMTIKFLSDRGYLKTSKQVASNIKEKKEQIVDRGEILRDQYNEEWRKFAKRMKEKSDQHRRK